MTKRSVCLLLFAFMCIISMLLVSAHKSSGNDPINNGMFDRPTSFHLHTDTDRDYVMLL
jgi:hypothetical protein